MVTRKMLADAAKKCQSAKVAVAPEVLRIKAEDSAEGDKDEVTDTQTEVRTVEQCAPSRAGLYKMTLGMARFLATKGCRIEALDEEFNNPPHQPCIEYGGCDQCVLQRAQNEQEDRLAAERLAKRVEIELAIEFYDGKGEELKRKTRNQASQDERFGGERQLFKKAIEDWRVKKMLELLDEIDICEDAFMSDKELLRIAKYKRLDSVTAFDNPAVAWAGLPEWRSDLLQVIMDLEKAEQEKAERKEAEERERKRQRAERQQKALAKQQERQDLEAEGPAPAQEAAETSTTAAPAHIQDTPARPVQTIRIRPDGRPAFNAAAATPTTSFVHGLPSPITPTTPLFTGSHPLFAPSQPVPGTSRHPDTPASTFRSINFTAPIISHSPSPSASQPPPASTPARPRRPRIPKPKLPGEVTFRLDPAPPPGQ